MKREAEKESKPNLILDSDDWEGEREGGDCMADGAEPSLRLKVDGNRRRFRGRSESNRKKEFQAAKRLLDSIEHPCLAELNYHWMNEHRSHSGGALSCDY